MSCRVPRKVYRTLGRVMSPMVSSFSSMEPEICCSQASAFVLPAFREYPWRISGWTSKRSAALCARGPWFEAPVPMSCSTTRSRE